VPEGPGFRGAQSGLHHKQNRSKSGLLLLRSQVSDLFQTWA
jgi:hypothetical protein